MTFEKPNDFEIKDNVMVDGITEDYVWYHAKLLQEKMTHWDLDFQKLVKVMESRHQEHLKMLDRALEENRILKRRLKEKEE
jgi:hypothetical protein